MTNRFDLAYEATPPWDIDRPQGAFVRLEGSGRIVSPVLDVGCGTGELALRLAFRGHEVVGVDLARAALDKARSKARERALDVPFVHASALSLGELGRTFQTVVDSGVFHAFDDAERGAYVASLAAVLRPGGCYFMLVFSDEEPADWGGPRRIRQDEIRSAFAQGFAVESIVPERFETNQPFHRAGGHAWLSTIRRL